MDKGLKIFIAVMLIAIIVGTGLSLLFGTAVSVDQGYAGIVINPMAQTMSDPIIGATWYLGGKAPWAYIEHFYIGTDKLGMWGDGSDEYADMPAVHSVSNDGLEVDVDLMIRWRLDVGRIRDLFTKYPMKNWKFDVIGSISRKAARNAVSEFNAIDIIADRTSVAEKILQITTDAINQQAASLMNAILDLEVELRDIIPPQTFLDSLQSKLNAEQEMLQAEFEKERTITLAEADKQKAIIMAEADAESWLIQAAAQGEAKIIVANATRDAIHQITTATGMENATQIAQLYMTLEALKAIAKDTGQMIVFLMMGDDGVPIIYPLQTP